MSCRNGVERKNVSLAGVLEPNKFVIVVYITDIIFTLYRMTSELTYIRVERFFFPSSIAFSSPTLPIFRFNEQKMIRCDGVSSILIKSENAAECEISLVAAAHANTRFSLQFDD